MTASPTQAAQDGTGGVCLCAWTPAWPWVRPHEGGQAEPCAHGTARHGHTPWHAALHSPRATRAGCRGAVRSRKGVNFSRGARGVCLLPPSPCLRYRATLPGPGGLSKATVHGPAVLSRDPVLP